SLLQQLRQSQRWAGISGAGLVRTPTPHVVEVAEPAAVLLGGLPGVVNPRVFVREFRPFRGRHEREFGNVIGAETDRLGHQAADAGVGRTEDHETLAFKERQVLVPAVRLAQVIAEGPVLLRRRSKTQPVHQHLLRQYGLNARVHLPGPLEGALNSSRPSWRPRSGAAHG